MREGRHEDGISRLSNVILLLQEAESGSSDHCSELYHGPSAGSEMEVKAIASFFESLGPVIGAVDFHSYHQEVLYPPGMQPYVYDIIWKFSTGSHFHGLAGV